MEQRQQKYEEKYSIEYYHTVVARNAGKKRIPVLEALKFNDINRVHTCQLYERAQKEFLAAAQEQKPKTPREQEHKTPRKQGRSYPKEMRLYVVDFLDTWLLEIMDLQELREINRLFPTLYDRQTCENSYSYVEWLLQHPLDRRRDLLERLTTTTQPEDKCPADTQRLADAASLSYLQQCFNMACDLLLRGGRASLPENIVHFVNRRVLNQLVSIYLHVSSSLHPSLLQQVIWSVFPAAVGRQAMPLAAAAAAEQSSCFLSLKLAKLIGEYAEEAEDQQIVQTLQRQVVQLWCSLVNATYDLARFHEDRKTSPATCLPLRFFFETGCLRGYKDPDAALCRASEYFPVDVICEALNKGVVGSGNICRNLHDRRDLDFEERKQAVDKVFRLMLYNEIQHGWQTPDLLNVNSWCYEVLRAGSLVNQKEHKYWLKWAYDSNKCLGGDRQFPLTTECSVSSLTQYGIGLLPWCRDTGFPITATACVQWCSGNAYAVQNIYEAREEIAKQSQLALDVLRWMSCPESKMSLCDQKIEKDCYISAVRGLLYPVLEYFVSADDKLKAHNIYELQPADLWKELVRSGAMLTRSTLKSNKPSPEEIEHIKAAWDAIALPVVQWLNKHWPLQSPLQKTLSRLDAHVMEQIIFPWLAEHVPPDLRGFWQNPGALIYYH